MYKRLVPLSSLVRDLAFALMGIAVGAGAGYAALGLILLIGFCHELIYGLPHADGYAGIAEMSPWRILLTLSLGGLFVGFLTQRLVKGGYPHGPADVIKAVVTMDGRMSLRDGIGSAVLSILSIGAGASVGRYGPALHLGATIGSRLARVFDLDRGRTLALLGCGAASSIAASFNAPLAGVVFAYEVILGIGAFRAFVPIAVAAVMGTTISRFHFGDTHLFSLPDGAVEHVYEYLLFPVIGVFGGILAVAFMRSMNWAGRLASRVPGPTYLRPALGGFLVGLIAIKYPHILGLGEAVISGSIAQVFVVQTLLALLLLKLLATAISLGFGFSGGIFGPALFMGAVLGAAIGDLFAMVAPYQLSEAGIYAVVGMGAVISRVVGAPLATILIVFELTSNYSLTTAVMLAVVVGRLVSRASFPRSWFEFQLKQAGIDMYEGRESRILKAKQVSEVMDVEFKSMPGHLLPDAAMAHMSALAVNEILVVDKHGCLIGTLGMTRLLNAPRQGAENAGDMALKPKKVAYADDDLFTAMSALRNYLGESVPVVLGPQNARVVGVLYEGVVIGAYADAVAEARREERGT